MSLPRPVPRLAGFFQGRGRGEALAYGLSRSPGSGECRVCIMFLTRKTITQRGGNHPNRRRQKPTGEGGGVGTAGEGGDSARRSAISRHLSRSSRVSAKVSRSTWTSRSNALYFWGISGVSCGIALPCVFELVVSFSATMGKTR